MEFDRITNKYYNMGREMNRKQAMKNILALASILARAGPWKPL